MIKGIAKILFIGLFFFQEIGFAQDLLLKDKKSRVDLILSARGEVYLAIPVSQRKSFIPLVNAITPDKQTDSLIYFYANSAQFKLVDESSLEYQVFTAPSMIGPVRMASGIDEVLSGQAYPTYQQYLDLMQQFSQNFPELCKIDTIGYSINGKLILSARLQKGGYSIGDKPTVFLSSTMHGDEVVGYSLMLMLINDFLTNAYSSPRISAILDDLVVIINPLSNPDGTYFQSDTSLYGATRFNSANADLNRNFPDVLKGMNYSVADLEKENKAMVSYMERYLPVVSANFHTGEEVLNYPWDSWFSYEYKHADDSWFIEICKDYVDIARSVDQNYLQTFSTGYVFGSDWYWIPRGRQDFVTYCLRGREITIELSKIKLPDASQISGFWDKNHDALINFIEKAGYGVFGLVSDSLTKAPIGALIEIPGYDKHESNIFGNPVSGKFFRYLPAGNYNLTVSATGCILLAS